MRIGFVGTGSFAERHAASLRKLGAEVVACASTNAEKARQFATAHGATVFAEPLAMIQRRHLDALYIAVPPFAHDGVVELAAARERIPFFVEKPVGLNLDVCGSVARAVEVAGLVTCVGYLLRESALLPDIRAVLKRNRLTSVRSCRMNGFPQVHWWRRMATSGGMMVEQATHMVDLMRHVFGEIRSVSAVTSSGISAGRWEGCDVYDSMEALMTFDGGLIGSIGISNVLEAGFSKIEIFEAFGRDFHLVFTFDGVRYREGVANWVETQAPSLDLCLDAENRRFLDAVQRGDPQGVTCTYADGLRTLAVTLAMNDSARTGATVRLE